MYRALAGFVSLVIMASGCFLAPEGDCTTILIPSIVAEVSDSVLGTPLAVGTVMYLREGTFIDSTRRQDPSPGIPALELPWLRERAGVYSVSVLRDGYRSWLRSGVRVHMDGSCHVRTTRLSVRLVSQ